VGNRVLSVVGGDRAASDDRADRVAGPSALSGASEQRVRIVEATLACIARFGLAKTTLDDVARQSGYSRATLYRAFPGGKEALLEAVVDTEVSRLFSELAVVMGEAESLEDVLVAGMTRAAERIVDHQALWLLMEHEPEVMLPHLAFDHRDRLLAEVAAFVAPFLGRWLAHEEALRVAEWATRVELSYLECPAESVGLTDAADVRRLVRTYVLPGINVLAQAAEGVLAPARPRTSVAVDPSLTSKGEAS
jgi:AcrR family transcriptional regulator